MKIEELVMPGDILTAVDRLSFCSYCMRRAAESYVMNDVESGDIWINEHLKARKELDAMIKAREENDKLKALASDLVRKGINVEIVLKIGGASVG